MMRILLCTTNYAHAASGSGRFAQLMAELGSHYPEVKIEVLTEDTAKEKVESSHGVHISRLAGSSLLGYWYKSRDYARALPHVLSRRNFDIVLFNDAWLAYHAGSIHDNVKMVVSIRDDNAMCLFDNALPALPGLFVRRWMERRAIRRARHVLTNSAYLCSAIARKYGVEERRIHVVYPGYVDFEALQPNGQRTISSPVKVLFAKQDIRRGGLKLLVEALGNLAQYQFRLTIVGPDAGEVKRKLGRRIYQLTNVECHLEGKVYDHIRLLSLMHKQDVFCVPARREAFGVANIEALAAGMRVVCFVTGGVPPLLRNYGFEIRTRSVDGVSEAIANAIQEDATVVAQKLEEGAAWVKEAYGISRTRRSLKQFLDQVYATSNPKSPTA